MKNLKEGHNKNKEDCKNINVNLENNKYNSKNIDVNIKNNNLNKNSKSKIRLLIKIAMLSAIAAVLMLFDFPLPFAPCFYELDFSEVPVLIGGFALGPIPAIVIEALKVLLKSIMKGTMTVGVGELANFVIGCALVFPVALIYKYNKSFKNAVLGLIIGIISLTVVGALMNYFVLIPFFSKVFMPLDVIVSMGTKINKNIVDLKTLIILAVVPFNLLKGIVTSVITMLIYKRLSPILHK